MRPFHAVKSRRSPLRSALTLLGSAARSASRSSFVSAPLVRARPVRRPRPTAGAGVALPAAVAAVVLLGLGPAGCDGSGPAVQAAGTQTADAFVFLRTRESIVRTDTSTGAVWFSAPDGETGWIKVGQAPSDAGKPSTPGRYRVSGMQPQQKIATLAKPPTVLLLMDQATGRAWTAPVRRGSEWEAIDEAPSAPETS